MAVNLERSIQRVYDGLFSYNYYGNVNMIETNLKFLSVPLKDKDTIEIPTMAMEKIMTDDFLNTEYDAIIIPLTMGKHATTYVSIEPMFKNVFCSKPADALGLIEMRIRKGSQIFNYYGGGGAIFDSNFNPILIASWLFENTNGELKVKKPILRISPHCFTRSNSLESFIVGKLLSQTLNMPLNYCYFFRHYFDAPFRSTDIRVIVEPIPFQIQSPRTPDINTTTQSLLNLVIDNQEEIACQ